MSRAFSKIRAFPKLEANRRSMSLPAPLVLAWVACSILSSLPVWSQGLFLHVLEVTTPAALPDPEVDLEVRWFGDDLGKAQRALSGGQQHELAADHLLIDLTADLRATDEPAEGHLEATFLIDFDEPSVVDLYGELRADLALGGDEQPSIEQLTRAVERIIVDKNMSRGWDLPSRVATRREGDCTEHAVLLAALARAAGWPSRVVTGIAIVWNEGESMAGVDGGQQGTSIGAFGHAWTEIWAGESWQVADGTGIDHQAPVRYLATTRVAQEGPGYALQLIDGFASWPRRLEVLAAK